MLGKERPVCPDRGAVVDPRQFGRAISIMVVQSVCIRQAGVRFSHGPPELSGHPEGLGPAP